MVFNQKDDSKYDKCNSHHRSSPHPTTTCVFHEFCIFQNTSTRLEQKKRSKKKIKNQQQWQKSDVVLKQARNNKIMTNNWQLLKTRFPHNNKTN